MRWFQSITLLGKKMTNKCVKSFGYIRLCCSPSNDVDLDFCAQVSNQSKNLWAIGRWSDVSAVCRAWVLSQPTHLWRAWCNWGELGRHQLKPRHNLRDLMRLAICSRFHSTCLDSFSTPLRQVLFFFLSFPFFLIRWDFIRPPLSVTAIGCEISEGKACGNHSISCAHLALHLYRRAGGFWKGEKSFTKSVSEAGFNTNRLEIFHTMFSRFLLDLRLFSLLVKPLSDCTGSSRDGITALKKKQYLGKESSFCMNSMSGKEKIRDAAVCRLRNPHQSDHSWPWMQTLEGWKRKRKTGAEWRPLPEDLHYVHYSAIHSKCLPPQARAPAYLRRRRQRFLFFFVATIEASYGCSVSSQREYTPTESNPPGPAEMNALGKQKGNPPEKWDGDQKKKKKKKSWPTKLNLS